MGNINILTNFLNEYGQRRMQSIKQISKNDIQIQVANEIETTEFVLTKQEARQLISGLIKVI